MGKDVEDPAPVPDPEAPEAATEPGGEAVSVAHLSEVAEWLEARLDALDNRFHRFDQISTRNTRQFSEDMADLRTTVSHLHERTGQLIAGTHRTLQDLLQAEIRAALEHDRQALTRAARRRTAWTLVVLVFIATGLGTAGLVLLEIWTP